MFSNINAVFQFIWILFTIVACQPSFAQRPEKLFGTSFGVPGNNATFDYIVVGGGTAGSTVATRLAQAGINVAVIEAGGLIEGENGNLSQVPAYVARNSAQENSLNGVNPLIDWRIMTTPQRGASDRVLHYPRGKCLGGSSNLNYMNYNRPTVQAMQKWAKDVEDRSYEWDNVLPHFKRSIEFTKPNQNILPKNISIGYRSNAFSSDGGPLKVAYPGYIYAFGSWARRALNELGLLENNLGFASGLLIGHQYTAFTYNFEDGTRSSAHTSFLELAQQTTTLTIYTHSLVKSVEFDQAKQARRILVDAGGQLFYLHANNEIIISAGAFQSPQLLMISGVGPARILQTHDIPIVADRAGVGQNMWDNIIFGPSYMLDLETAAIISNPQTSDFVLTDYFVNRTSPLSNIGFDYVAYDKISNQTWANVSSTTRTALEIFPADWPEAEWFAGSEYYGRGLGPPDNRNYGSILIGLLAPLSRGNITINSADMADPPVVNPNWMTHEVDHEIAIAAFKRARAIFKTKAMQEVVLGKEVWPGLNTMSNAEILEYIQSTYLSLAHAASTCKMGRRADPMAVVDSSGHVIGVDRLRVVDISSFPFLPPGQPQATVYMLAEKIAHDIISSRYGTRELE